MIKNIKELSGASALFGAAFIFATFGPLIREMASMFGDIALAAARFIMAAIIVLAIIIIKRTPLGLPRNQALTACLLGAAGAVTLVLFTIAVNNTTISGSVAMLYAGVIVSSLIIGRVAFKEKLSSIKFLAVALALCGLFAYSQSLGILSLGLLTALSSGIFEGISNALRKALSKIDRITVMAYQFGIGSLLLLITTIASSEHAIKEISLLPIISTIIFGSLLVCVNYLLLYGFKRFDVNIGSVILATELVFSTIFGWLLFNEIPNSGELFGLALIFLAAVLSSIDFKIILKKSALLHKK